MKRKSLTEKPWAPAEAKFHSILARRRSGCKRLIIIFWALLGPGFIAAMANNDAGGVIAYAATGAKFGMGVFAPLVLLLAPLLFTVQEMSLRLGVVTRSGFSELARQRYGRIPVYYHIMALALENFIVLITEFMGMTAGLVLLGCPIWLGSLLCLLLVGSFVILTGYWTKERIALFVGALNFVFLLVAWMTRPDLAAVGRAMITWHTPHALHDGVVWYIIAMIGNAIAPWMIFFQGNGSVDKGVTSRELRLGRLDTALGSIFQVLIAASIIASGAAIVGHVQNLEYAGPADLIVALGRVAGRWPAILFSYGLFNAGFLAAITVSLASSWSIAELFGWSRSLNDKLTEAPKFYAIYLGGLLLASLVIIIPHLPMNLIALAAQVMGGLLLVPILVLMILMTSDKTLMGCHATRPLGIIWGWIMISLLSGMAIATLWQLFVAMHSHSV